MNSLPEFLLFLGRLHPMLVHLPIGFLVLLAGLEVLARLPRFRNANASAGYVLALAVPAAVFSAACGWLLSLESGHDPQFLAVHRWAGTATAVLSLATAVCYRFNWRRGYGVCLAVTAGALAVTGHFGGSLTHGSRYLIEHAPGPIRALFGSGDAASRTSARVDDIMDRPLFSGIVQPLLRERCTTCHNPQKRKGGLQLDTLDGILKGGESTPAVVPGRAGESEMIRRLLLPLDDDDHMPPQGKPQPTPEEIALLRWWIDAGAPATGTARDLKPPSNIEQLLRDGRQSSK
ncbi:MAG: hypothetical protein HZA90_17945 [Verrucomicrobia bacterium]|nr:hypothetical protein [Verrucomicrobiota bacterium]